ncbi:2-amino-4-hydroxy-6-hydroxymethyldihydropteridine diphosphokinase, partial [Actinotalea ferrariae]|uniref:2-amino-4-hydroxy-6- hydroxymethyldihydropteridine diphosphokinase n=1 Tax=Actinotalea ferrariae TaxID=1386098 RepID=UPI001EB296A9
ALPSALAPVPGGLGGPAWSPVQGEGDTAWTPAPDGGPAQAAWSPAPEPERTAVLDAAHLQAPPVPAAPVPDGPLADRLDAVPTEPVEVVLALGSNIGASHDILRQVVRDLAGVPGVEITAIAPLARTQAVGGPEQPDFLNTIVLARTTLSPRGLLAECHRLEDAHGRVRTEHWGPRTIDVDIVLYGGVVAVADDLELPHPRAHQRAFVLEPWAQVQPDAMLPGLGGGPVAALAQTAPDRGGIRWMALDWWAAPE